MTGQSDRAENPRADGGMTTRRITVRGGRAVRHFTLTPRTQILAGLGAAALLAWTGAATVTAIVNHAEREALAARVAAFESGSADAVAEAEARLGAEKASVTARLKGALEEAEARHAAAMAEAEHLHADELGAAVAERDARIASLDAERAALAGERADLSERLEVLSKELSRRQARLLEATDAEAELSLALESLRGKLRDAVSDREQAERRQAAALRDLDELSRRSAAADAAEHEWSGTVTGLTEALERTTRERDAAALMQASLADQLATLDMERSRADEARARIFAQLEDAVQAGLGQLDNVFARIGIDPDRLVAQIRRDYQGEGGPFIPVDGDAAPQLASADASRVAGLMGRLERASLMQIAAAKLPLSRPVRDAYRFTSGFGVRRDPKNGRSRMHSGLDFAASVGTPIHSAADGVVTFSGWQSGYGRVVKVRHAFGFETVYAHLNKARVKVGDRVAKDDRIGDMGRTGRVTGTHLHYEIRMNGRPVNPMKYIEAARNVL